MLTVRQLIKELIELDLDLRVCLSVGTGSSNEPLTVEARRVELGPCLPALVFVSGETDTEPVANDPYGGDIRDMDAGRAAFSSLVKLWLNFDDPERINLDVAKFGGGKITFQGMHTFKPCGASLCMAIDGEVQTPKPIWMPDGCNGHSCRYVLDHATPKCQSGEKLCDCCYCRSMRSCSSPPSH